MINQTILQEFILIGFSVYPHVQICLFVVFLCLYMVTLAGNLTIMGLTWADRYPHTPMYYFLSALSFSETYYTLTIIPKMLVDLLDKDNRISDIGCGLQMCFFLGLGRTHCILLTVIGYDRFLAICNTLKYPLLMTNVACGQHVATAWVGGFLISLIETTLIFRVSFCIPNLIRHFFCHMRAVLRLSYTDSNFTEFIVTLMSVSGLLGTFLLILLTYVFILSSVLKTPSTEGKQKAFPPCASHLTVAIIHFVFAPVVYLKPENSRRDDTLIAVLYTIITPFFSPIIFTLRNKDMKNAFRKIMRKTVVLKK